MSMLLEIEDCSVEFGGLKAVDSLSLKLEEGGMLALIGPNGAGKTTVFNIITGVYSPSRGGLCFDGRSIVGLPSHEINRLGIARTFQNIRLFKNLNVLDNVMVAFNQRAQRNVFGILAATERSESQKQEICERSLALLDWMGLARFKDDVSVDLPYGFQRRLEIARALATQPRLLLLDEPAAGMNSKEKLELAHLIDRLRQEFKLTLLLIEHDMKMVMNHCPRILVLDHGQKIAEGSPSEIQKNPKVIEAYLGAAV